ncbi:MAG TPA: CHAD domain-containing protein [Steroidobacteraceae bacterium]|jgi:CHAD domain-containing protein|nr:CHAD domain-containing protein [Steroidobacteraceae bacterium]
MTIKSAPKTSVNPSLRKLLQQLLIRAIALESARSARKVHQARQEMKRARAVLRLMRGEIGTRAYRSANAAVRDAARPLSPVRDAKVLLDTLDSICRGDLQLRESYLALHAGFKAAQRQAGRQLTRQSVRQSGASMAQAGRRLQGVPLRMPDARSARLGVKRIYRSGRKAMDGAAKGADDKLHEWRKQAKYLSTQAAIAGDLFGAKLKKIRRRAHKLSSLLGEDHDLAQLNAKLSDLGANASAGREALVLRIGHRRRELQRRARKLGKRLYRRSAKHFAAKLSRKIG